MIDARAQGLEDILQRLEDRLIGILDKDMPNVCIHCWDFFGECGCEDPTFWPLNHAVGKIRGMLGFEGYDLP